MASGYTPTQMDPSAGGGGSGWERDINNPNKRDVSTAQPQYDRFGNTLGFGWKEPDGSITLITGDRYSGDGGMIGSGGDFSNKGFVRDQVNATGERVSPGSSPGSGGGNGAGAPLSRLAGLIPGLAGAAGALGGNGSGSNTTMPPELQQLLQMSLQRMTAQDPLFKSINAQAMAGLPTAYQRS